LTFCRFYHLAYTVIFPMHFNKNNLSYSVQSIKIIKTRVPKSVADSEAADEAKPHFDVLIYFSL